jgi:hypothetical protein
MNTKYVITAGAAVALILSAGTAFADSDKDKGGDERHGLRLGAFIGLGNNAELKAEWKEDKEGAREHRAEIKAEAKTRLEALRERHGDEKDGHARHAVRGEVTAISGTTLTVVSDDGTYSVAAADAEIKGGAFADIEVGDTVIVKGEFDGSAVTAEKIYDVTLVRETIAERLSHFRVGEVTSVAGSVFTINPRGDKEVVTVTTDSNTAFRINGVATSESALTVGSKVFLTGTTTASSTDADAFSASIVDIITDGFKKLKHWFWFR